MARLQVLVFAGRFPVQRGRSRAALKHRRFGMWLVTVRRFVQVGLGFVPGPRAAKNPKRSQAAACRLPVRLVASVGSKALCRFSVYQRPLPNQSLKRTLSANTSDSAA